MPTKAIVKERALEARVRRALEKDGIALKKARYGTSAYGNLGSYYMVDYSRNAITDTHVDLVAWAKELGVMQEWEELEETA